MQYLTLNNILLAVFIVLYVYRAAWDAKDYQKFKKIRDTKKRQKEFKSWAKGSMLLFGFGSIICSLLIGIPLLDIGQLPKEFLLQLNITEFMGMGQSLTILLFLILILTLQTKFFIKRRFFPLIGNVEALLPRNNDERKYGYILSINAGISEELAFRYLLPILLVGAGIPVNEALLLAVMIFGFGHAYQGILGVLGTGFIGFLLMSMYIVTGNILLPILVHIINDARVFYMGPYIIKWNSEIKRDKKRIINNITIRRIIGLST